MCVVIVLILTILMGNLSGIYSFPPECNSLFSRVSKCDNLLSKDKQFKEAKENILKAVDIVLAKKIVKCIKKRLSLFQLGAICTDDKSEEVVIWCHKAVTSIIKDKNLKSTGPKGFSKFAECMKNSRQNTTNIKEN